jgi:hypothetical protein
VPGPGNGTAGHCGGAQPLDLPVGYAAGAVGHCADTAVPRAREWLEVFFLPVVVFLAGMSWVQAGAWRLRGTLPARLPAGMSPRVPLAALIILLLVFQRLLRPGIDFF